MVTRYRVEGMTCGGCVKSVTSALEKAGLRAEVVLEAAEAQVDGAPDEATVRAVIERAGFGYGGVVAAAR